MYDDDNNAAASALDSWLFMHLAQQEISSSSRRAFANQSGTKKGDTAYDLHSFARRHVAVLCLMNHRRAIEVKHTHSENGILINAIER